MGGRAVPRREATAALRGVWAVAVPAGEMLRGEGSVIVYLASPNTQQQAEHVCDMPVLLSYACHSPWLDKYQQSFARILIDSGAFSELTGATRVDLAAYADWAERWRGHVDAVASLDDISGDWRRGLRNIEAMPAGLGFPTFHETDPWELLPDLCAIARERGNWIGLGLLPPRSGKEMWMRRAVERIPEDLHIHGWACREYTHIRRLDSVDSTNWWRDAMALRKELPWLTYGECLGLIVKRYQRWQRVIRDVDSEQIEMEWTA